jgi:hypothetical protein
LITGECIKLPFVSASKSLDLIFFEDAIGDEPSDASDSSTKNLQPFPAAGVFVSASNSFDLIFFDDADGDERSDLCVRPTSELHLQSLAAAGIYEPEEEYEDSSAESIAQMAVEVVFKLEGYEPPSPVADHPRDVRKHRPLPPPGATSFLVHSIHELNHDFYGIECNIHLFVFQNQTIGIEKTAISRTC